MTATTELLMRVMSEVKLYQNIAQCRQIECANSTHVLQKGRLDKAFNASVKADADANLLQEAQLLLTKMNAEIILKECEEFPWEPTEQGRQCARGRGTSCLCHHCKRSGNCAASRRAWRLFW